MNRLTRRTLFARLGRTTAAATVVSLLAGCPSGGLSPSQLQQDVQTLSDGLTSIVGWLQSLPAADQPSADIIAKIQAALATIKSDAAAIAGATQPGQSIIQQIGTAVGVIADLAGPFFPAAPLVAMVVQAALALLPSIFGAVGLVPPARATKAVYTAAQSRLILKGSAAVGK